MASVATASANIYVGWAQAASSCSTSPVRPAIEAPAHVAIHRQEIYDALFPKTGNSPAAKRRADESAGGRERSSPIE